MKSNMSIPIEVQLGGTQNQQNNNRFRLNLEPRKRTVLETEYSSLIYLALTGVPDGSLGLHNTARRETILVERTAWRNLWVYGIQIIFTGYITRGAFWQQATRLTSGDLGLVSRRPDTELYGLPMRELNPIKNLLEQAKEWYRGQLPR